MRMFIVFLFFYFVVGPLVYQLYDTIHDRNPFTIFAPLFRKFFWNKEKKDTEEAKKK